MSLSTAMFTAREPFILASASPRRNRLLAELGIDFKTTAADVDESPLPGENPEDFVQRLAHEKARIVSREHLSSWVLGADTVVTIDGDILGKPVDEMSAAKMLQRFACRWHEVWTGFSLINGERDIAETRAVKTEVLFSDLREDVINAYVATGESMDKAGAYGIQGKGGALVERINGSFSNVVGLPLVEVLDLLLSWGVIEAKKM